MKGDLTGDVAVDYIGELWLEGEISSAVNIEAQDAIDSIIARKIAGGVNIECLGTNANGYIRTIRAGWYHLSNPNAQTMGASGNPVVVRANTINGQQVNQLSSYGSMYLDAVVSGPILIVGTSISANIPSGLTQYDASINVVCTRLDELKVPYHSNGADTADLAGSVHITGSGGFTGEFSNDGICSASVTIDYGLTGSGTSMLFGDDGLAGQVVINNADASGTWATEPTVQVGSTSLEAGYPQTPADLGGGAIGVVPFPLHDEACDPPNGSSIDVFALDGWLTLDFYGPIMWSDTPITIERRAFGQLNWTDVTSSFTWSLKNDGKDRTLLITGPDDPLLAACADYRITPTEDLLCDLLDNPSPPQVASFLYELEVTETGVCE